MKAYEANLNIDFGIKCFVANVAFIQLTPEEYIILNPPSQYTGNIFLTTQGLRPKLIFNYWIKGADYPEKSENLPKCEVLIDDWNRFQIRDVCDVEQDWESAPSSDHRIQLLRDLFLGFAFYPSLVKEMKQVKK